MKRSYSPRLIAAGGIGLLVVGATASFGPIIITSTWTAGGDGQWNDPANWDSPDFPNNNIGETYDVIIDSSVNDVTVTLDGGSFTIRDLTVDAGDTLSIDNAHSLRFGEPAAITNAGEIVLDSTVSVTSLDAQNGEVTVDGGGVISLRAANARIQGSTWRFVDQTVQGVGNVGLNSAGIINEAGSVITANELDAVLIVDPNGDGAVNAGVFRAENGGQLSLNAGSYDALGGVFEALDGSSINVISTVNITSGAVETAGDGVFQVDNTLNIDAVANPFTNNGRLLIDNGHVLEAEGDLVNTNLIEIGSTVSTTTFRSGAEDLTLSGGGEVFLTANNARIASNGGGRVINVDNLIRGVGNVGLNTASLDNAAEVRAEGGQLILDPGGDGFTNTGVMAAASGATLRFNAGEFDNTGGLIRANAGGVVALGTGVDIMNGELTTVGDGLIELVGTATLFDVLNTGVIDVPNSRLLLVADTMTNTGDIMLSSTVSITQLSTFEGTDTVLDGGGRIIMSSANNNRFSGAGVFTNVDNTIEGAGNIGVNSLGIENFGEIIGNVSNTLILDPGPDGFRNGNLIVARDGGTVRFQSGLYDNIDGVVRAETGSVVQFSGMELFGGVLETEDDGVMELTGTLTLAGDVNPPVIEGLLVVPNTRLLIVSGELDNRGEVRLNSTGSITTLNGATPILSLTGEGVLTMSDAPNNRINGVDSIVNVNNTVSGSGNVGVNTAGLLNGEDGVFRNSAQPGLTFDPDVTGFLNEGRLEALAPEGEIILGGGPFENRGEILIEAGAFVNRATSEPFVQTDGVTTVNGSLETSSATGVVNLEGGILEGVGAVEPDVLNTGGDVAPGESAGLLTFQRDYQQTLGGRFDVEIGGYTPGTEHDQLVVDGAASLSGTIRVQFLDPFVPNVGDEFVILTAGDGVSGAFQCFDEITVGGGFVEIVYEENLVKAVIVRRLTPTVVGDLDLDGDVDPADLAGLLSAWGPCTGECCPADFDNSGDVGPADLATLLANWG